MNKEFLEFCKQNGIKKESTISYSPQHNGAAKRKNRTIMEMARCMLHSRKIKVHLWVEAIYTVVYILNRTPTKVIMNITLKRLGVEESLLCLIFVFLVALLMLTFLMKREVN